MDKLKISKYKRVSFCVEDNTILNLITCKYNIVTPKTPKLCSYMVPYVSPSYWTLCYGCVGSSKHLMAMP